MKASTDTTGSHGATGRVSANQQRDVEMGNRMKEIRLNIQKDCLSLDSKSVFSSGSRMNGRITNGKIGPSDASIISAAGVSWFDDYTYAEGPDEDPLQNVLDREETETKSSSNKIRHRVVLFLLVLLLVAAVTAITAGVINKKNDNEESLVRAPLQEEEQPGDFIAQPKDPEPTTPSDPSEPEAALPSQVEIPADTPSDPSEPDAPALPEVETETPTGAPVPQYWTTLAPTIPSSYYSEPPAEDLVNSTPGSSENQVGTNSSSEPSSAPTTESFECKDDDKQKIYISDWWKKKKCDWLAGELRAGTRRRVCNPGHEAFDVCPVSCGRCLLTTTNEDD